MASRRGRADADVEAQATGDCREIRGRDRGDVPRRELTADLDGLTSASRPAGGAGGAAEPAWGARATRGGRGGAGDRGWWLPGPGPGASGGATSGVGSARTSGAPFAPLRQGPQTQPEDHPPKAQPLT